MKLSHIDGLVQERRNSIANALELRLSCANPYEHKKLKNMEINDKKNLDYWVTAKKLKSYWLH